MRPPISLSEFTNQAFNAVEVQLKKYPNSSLKDIYKSFYQDAYGPGHLLEDPLAAREYFNFELAHLTGCGPYTIEPCGIGQKFYRVDLGYIIEGRIDRETYFTQFLQSMADLEVPDATVWIQQWLLVLSSLEPISHLIENFEQDSHTIAEAIGKGRFGMRHSELYRSLYNPHYRIMRKEYVKLLLIH